MKLLLALLTLVSCCYAADVAGHWAIAVPGRDGGEAKFTLWIRQAADGYSGLISGEQGEVPLSDVKVNESELTFKVVTDEVTYVVSATVDGETIKGRFKVNDREGGTFAGKRASAPKPSTN